MLSSSECTLKSDKDSSLESIIFRGNEKNCSFIEIKSGRKGGGGTFVRKGRVMEDAA